MSEKKDVLFEKIALYKSGLSEKTIKEDYQEISLLVKKTSNINYVDPNGTTYLILAVTHCCEELVELLLNAGADPNIGDKNKVSPLSMALIHYSPQRYTIVSLLLEYGANPLQASKGGQTPIDIATMQQDAEMVKYLEKYIQKNS